MNTSSITHLAVVLAASMVCGCTGMAPPTGTPAQRTSSQRNATLSELAASVDYVPLSPYRITENAGIGCVKNDTVPATPLLDALPNIISRLAIGKVTSSGSVAFGPVAAAAVKNESYVVVLDYANSDTITIPIGVTERVDSQGTITSYDLRRAFYRNKMGDDGNFITDAEGNRILDVDEAGNSILLGDGYVVALPILIGVGVRLTANVTVLKGEVKVASLIGLAAEAQAERISGMLTVETLGVSGGPISTAVPIPTQLNEGTIQNAILSMGGIKASFPMDEDGVRLTPQVLGFRNLIGGGPDVTRQLTQIIASNGVFWDRPCEFPRGAAASTR